MKLIILDRDGVINYDSDFYIKSPSEWIPIPGSLEAVAALNQAGYKISIATNQSGINRGIYTLDALSAIHEKMRLALADVGGQIDSIFFCPHTPNEACPCRKPKPGLLRQIATHYQCDITKISFVGDSLRDIEAARAVSCKSILVRTGNGSSVSASHLIDVDVYDDLAQVAKVLCA